MATWHHLASFSLTAAILACSPPPDEATELHAQALEPFDELATDCTKCTGNSATVGDGIVFDDVHFAPSGQQNLPNRGEMHVLHTRRCLLWSTPEPKESECLEYQEVDLSVHGGRLGARATASGADVTDLLPGSLVIEFQHIDGARFELLLDTAEDVDYWITPSTKAGQKVRRYRVLYRMSFRPDVPAGSQIRYRQAVETTFVKERRICLGQNSASETREYEALFFEGEKFDSSNITTWHSQSPRDDGWYNLACEGSAIAKMHYMRHTIPSRADAHTYSSAANQAFLKMLAADYCGKGLSRTRNGQPLLYSDFVKVKSPGFPPALDPSVMRQRVEAVWSDEGAVCLNSPRLYSRSAVQTECPLTIIPECPQHLDMWSNTEYRETVVTVAGIRHEVRIPYMKPAPGRPPSWPLPYRVVSVNP